jgi:predicted MFS family arabinose efflux permease
MNPSSKLFSFEFIALNLILVAAFCNVSVFYSFYHYLGVINIPVAWRGFLVGLEPMAAFALRLWVIPWIHLHNAFTLMTISLALLGITSCAYLWAVTIPALIVLRIIHGAVFVLLTASTIALIVHFIPKEKSGQGFSTVSVATTIPYAIIPSLTEALLPYVRSEADIYAGVSIFSLLALSMISVFSRRFRKTFENVEEALMRRPSIREIRENFRQRPVVLLLAAGLFVYLGHATVFYFIKDLSLQSGLGDVGIFFMVSMLAIIATRAFGGALFDRLDKRHLLETGIISVALCLILLSHAGSRTILCLIAGLYGLSVGVMLPMLNALLFMASPPPLRSLNTNITLFTLDAGYFIMPYFGGMLITFGAGVHILFYCSAGFMLLAFFIISLGLSTDRET